MASRSNPSALLCVSFGTTVPGARCAIAAVEQALRDAVPHSTFARAFTSPTVRRVLAARGETVDSLPQALDRLCEAGFRDVVVQPTHFLYGFEYDALRAEAAAHTAAFDHLRLGRPLLGGTDDLRDVAMAVSAAYPRREGEALLLMGHGTDHFAGVVYPAMQTVFRLIGRTDVYVGTVEGWPTLDDVLMQLQADGIFAVHLAPLMLVAGDHACNDMAGAEPQSWAGRLTAAGFAVRSTVRGLGGLPAIQALYARHLRELLHAEPTV